MRTGRDGRGPDPDDEVVGSDVRELLATDDERAPADLRAVVTAMAREASAVAPPATASVPASRDRSRRQRLVPIAAVLALSVGVVPLVVRDAPTRSESVAPASAPAGAPAPVIEADRAAVVADVQTLRGAPAAEDAIVSQESLAEAEPALGTPAPEARGTADPSAAIPARPPTAVRKVDTSRDGARRIVELLRARGVDAALEGYVAWRARWPEADLAKLVGEAGDDGLERLREAVALRGLPPLSPIP